MSKEMVEVSKTSIPSERNNSQPRYEMIEEGEAIALLYHTTGERVIIVVGVVYVIKSRISGTLDKYISCIAQGNQDLIAVSNA